ncbi:putative secreted protein (Por secretion system target) [Breznakibacter xylanolyticus]|uniref:Putative secreted protein (Por secretion system target) n=2 Tax=Breznakibacter xylanolyticus TaxID=990 RepID=A0A2W7P9L8_9BACT|nr:putative secreted protein (Por secretion system target) [Breznakibacter xylanolyticus]
MTLALMMVTVVGWGALYIIGFPQVNTITQTTAVVSVKTDAGNQTSAYVVLLSNSPAPSLEQVFNHLDANDNAVPSNLCGDINIINAKTTYTAGITGLTPNTSYTAYFVTYDTEGNTIETTTPRSKTFTTQNIPFNYLATYPNIQDILDISATAYSSLNYDNSSTRFVVLTTTEAAPSLEQVWSGLDASGNAVSTSRKGTIIIDLANSTNSAFFDNLTENTSYNVYFASKDQAGNFLESSTPTIVTFTTIDQTKPTITFTPINGVKDVPINQIITIAFNEPIRNIDNTPIDNSNVTSLVALKMDGNIVASSVEISGNTITITPSSLLTEGKEYQLTLQPIEDYSNNATELTTIIFETNDTSAPFWLTTTPTNNSVSNSITANIILNYNEAIRNANDSEITSTTLHNSISTSPTFGFTASIDGTKKTITITPKIALEPNTTYTITVTNIEDKYNNLKATDDLVFKTAECNVWNGNTSSDWNTASNWNGTYSAGKSIIIEKGEFNPVINTNYDCANVVVKPGAGLNIPNGVTVNASQEFQLQSSNDPQIGNAYLYLDGTGMISAGKNKIYQSISNNTYWYTVSSPVSGATPSNINSTGGFQYWRDTDGTWQTISNTATLTQGQGYRSYSYTDYVFSGAINNDPSYTFTANYNSKNAGWGLAGNPYPCAINWNALDTTMNIKNQFHIWLNFEKKYGSYNGTIGTNLNSKNPNYIPSNHAFWVRVYDISTVGNSGTLTIPKTARVQSNSTYLKTTSTNELQYLRLSGIKGDNKDEMVVGIFNNSSDNFDDTDTEKWFATKNTELLELYTITNDKKLTISGYENLDGCKIIPVGFKAGSKGTFKINLDEIVNIPEDTKIELYDIGDSNNEIRTDLKSVGSYSFVLNEATTNDNRFLLVLETPNQSNNVSEPKKTQIKLHSQQSKLYVSTPELTNPTIQILNTKGQIINQSQLTTGTINIFDLKENGIYIVKINSLEENYQEKVLISK